MVTAKIIIILLSSDTDNNLSAASLCGTVYLCILKVIYHSLYSMNNFVTNKSKLPRDGAQGLLIWGDWLSCDPLRGSHDSQSPHILCEGHMIANHLI